MNRYRAFMPGEWVEVRSFAELRATLDADGALDGLPFMPEMLRYCGRRLRVSRRVEQTCVESGGVKIRRLPGVVLLEDLRCDGGAHDGCEKSCSLLWKDAWLKVPAEAGEGAPPRVESTPPGGLRTKNDDETYVCQSSRLMQATRPLAKWNPRRWFLGLVHRGLGGTDLLRYALLPLGIKVRAWARLRRDTQPYGQLARTPAVRLGLQPGEAVRVKTRAEIEGTLDRAGKNRGMAFTSAMLPHCNGRYVVKRRIARMIDEATGRMRTPEDTVLLESVTCDGHTIVGGCPRDVFHFWREAWLQRDGGERGAATSPRGEAAFPHPR
jgi:hypothetical protein